jgi:hypothetical protein
MAKSLGAVQTLSKPYSAEELLIQVRNSLGVDVKQTLVRSMSFDDKVIDLNGEPVLEFRINSVAHCVSAQRQVERPIKRRATSGVNPFSRD